MPNCIHCTIVGICCAKQQAISTSAHGGLETTTCITVLLHCVHLSPKMCHGKSCLKQKALSLPPLSGAAARRQSRRWRRRRRWWWTVVHLQLKWRAVSHLTLSSGHTSNLCGMKYRVVLLPKSSWKDWEGVCHRVCGCVCVGGWVGLHVGVCTCMAQFYTSSIQYITLPLHLPPLACQVCE